MVCGFLRGKESEYFVGEMRSKIIKSCQSLGFNIRGRGAEFGLGWLPGQFRKDEKR